MSGLLRRMAVTFVVCAAAGYALAAGIERMCRR